MFHNTSVGPVLDENDKPVAGKSFHVKGVLESNNATRLLTEDEFRALVVDDISFSATAGGGFEYSLEVVVSEQKLSAIQAANAKAAADKAKADAEAAQAQVKAQNDAELKAAKAAAFEEGRKSAVLDAARAAGAASVAKPTPPPNA